MKQIHKDYAQPFLLETTKLNRLLDIIHGRLRDHTGTTNRDEFEVSLSEQRREEMSSVEDVLSIDNGRKSKVQRLLITCFASTDFAGRPEHEVQVDFDGRHVRQTKIIVSVRSDNAGWCDRALSEVEEQIERTSPQDAPPRTVLALLGISLPIVLVIMVLSSIFPVGPGNRDADVLWLRRRDIDRVEQILKQDHPITEMEMREITTMQLRNVLESDSESQPSGWTRQKAYFGIPLLGIFGCVAYLILKCYPNAVFLWGDEIERYDRIKHSRRIVWGVVVGVMVVGILSKFLTAALFST